MWQQYVRVRIKLVKETSSILFVKDTSEAPWLLNEGLDVLNLEFQNVTRLGSFNVERPSKIVNLSEIYIPNVIRTVIVSYLSSSPIQTLNLYHFTLSNSSNGWDFTNSTLV